MVVSTDQPAMYNMSLEDTTNSIMATHSIMPPCFTLVEKFGGERMTHRVAKNYAHLAREAASTYNYYYPQTP